MHQSFTGATIFDGTRLHHGETLVVDDGRVRGLGAGTGSEEVINDDIDGLLIRPNRSLSETLNLVFDEGFPTKIYIKKAREDTKKRFDQVTNFSRIKKVLEA
jgi:hypothetical protein